MLPIENLNAGIAVRILAPALLVGACPGEAQASAAIEPEFTCSAVRSEHQKAREQIRQRVDETRAAVARAGKKGEGDRARDREFLRLMNDIERMENRFAVRSRKCVGE